MTNENKKIMVTKSSLPGLEEYIDEISDLWDTYWITNMGEKHKKLERELEKFLNIKNLTLFSNGHLALESVIESFGISGEVITTPFTFASTAHAIVRNGLTPVFCDINPDDYTLDVNKIKELITSKTSAIVPVHVYGNVCDVIGIKEIADKYNLKIIYDAAHSFGVTVDGVGIGNFGDASIFSFHATKVFNTIEGGAVTYGEDSLKQSLNNIKNFGITGPETVSEIGGNAKMNEFQAAMGLCNLRHIDSEISKRKKLANRYISNLSEVQGLKLQKQKPGVKSNYAYFPIIFDGFKRNRDEVFEKLRTQNIYSRKYFYPLVSDFDCYRDEYNSDETPVAKYVSERVLTLPLYADLPLEDVDRICEIIIKMGCKE
ncbi:MAG: DegT/DnrJ/EryC1/StrS family aminotransferase [Halanaerobiales bacterium]|nr:DegT/DnrJ/EryC1/StrS family aminotransferase [Halanaerobiales bacterium]